MQASNVVYVQECFGPYEMYVEALHARLCVGNNFLAGTRDLANCIATPDWLLKAYKDMLAWGGSTSGSVQTSEYLESGADLYAAAEPVVGKQPISKFPGNQVHDFITLLGDPDDEHLAQFKDLLSELEALGKPPLEGQPDTRSAMDKDLAKAAALWVQLEVAVDGMFRLLSKVPEDGDIEVMEKYCEEFAACLKEFNELPSVPVKFDVGTYEHQFMAKHVCDQMRAAAPYSLIQYSSGSQEAMNKTVHLIWGLVVACGGIHKKQRLLYFLIRLNCLNSVRRAALFRQLEEKVRAYFGI
jgi:hypothetical protein